MAKGKKKEGRVPRRKEEFTFRGYTLDEVKAMDLEQFMQMIPARQRRTLRRGMSPEHQDFLAKLQSGKKQELRTHLRDFVILPQMVGRTVQVHDGKAFQRVEIQPEMLGHYLGEFALTRQRVTHGSAGIGATRGSKYVPLK